MTDFHLPEIVRWKGRSHRFLGADLPLRDSAGAARAIAEGGWLAVVYPKDRAKAYIESLERAEVTRSFSFVRGTGRNQQEESIIVTKLTIESSVGPIEWTADANTRFYPADPAHARTFPFLSGGSGNLILPGGRRQQTGCGSGFFDAEGLVHAFAPWRDVDVAGGWKAITEVSHEAPDELRPLLAALPLLLFTSPPGLFG